MNQTAAQEDPKFALMPQMQFLLSAFLPTVRGTVNRPMHGLYLRCKPLQAPPRERHTWEELQLVSESTRDACMQQVPILNQEAAAAAEAAAQEK
jgi:hypothetical protein